MKLLQKFEFVEEFLRFRILSLRNIDINDPDAFPDSGNQTSVFGIILIFKTFSDIS